MSDTTPNGLFAKIVAASRLITHVPKNGFNAHHKFHFASHDDVTDVVKNAMDTVGLCLIPVRSVAVEAGKLTRVTVTSMLADPDSGQTHTIEWQGEGSDAQDKALYKALTQAKKTVLLNLFLIPTGDYEADGDYGHGYSEKKAKDAKKPGSPPRQQDPPRSNGATVQAPPKTPMFCSLTAANQEQGRKKFFALANEIWRGYPDVAEQAYKFCDEILGFDDSQQRVALRASTAVQVQEAIAALDTERADALKRAALTGVKN